MASDRCRLLRLLFAPFLLAATAVAEEPTGEGVEFFEARIRPVLVAHCYECHSVEAAKKEKLKGGLYLDSREAMRKGGESGEAVVAGKPDESLLISALKYDSFDMPPSGKLPPKVIADFEKWIEMGAPDPRDGEAPEVATPSVDWEAAREFWSFRPVTSVEVPEATGDWGRNEIDRFVARQLARAELKPVREATRREWLRRVTFDLTGLPPTPEEIDAFERDPSDTAYETVVDRLLASPRYGERWARHWLDVARYAEDQAHTFSVRKKTSAYQYRDWVIRAFNEDMPYDRFVELQLAGDLLDAADDDRFTQLAGLGFLGLGAEYYKNTAKEQAIADELDDRVDTVTRAFLGLTVSCARCHDHKYDPIPTRDYYSLAGIFNGSRLTDAPLVSAEVVKAYDEGQKRVQAADGEIKKWLKEIGARRARREADRTAEYVVDAWRAHVLGTADPVEESGLHGYFVKRWHDYLADGNRERVVADLTPLFAIKANDEPDDSTTPAEVTELAERFGERLRKLMDGDQKSLEKADKDLLKAIRDDGRGPFFVNEKEAEKHFLDEAAKTELAKRRSELDTLKKSVPAKYPVAHVLQGGPKAMPVYVRGNPATKGELAPRRFLQVLDPDVAADPKDEPPVEPSGEPSKSDPLLFASKRIDVKTPGRAVEIDVSLNGARELHLVIDGAGDGISCDWADWAEPRLVAEDGTETRLTDLDWVEATTGWNAVRKGRNASGGELKIDGKPVAYGIGAHARSHVHFKIPEDTVYTRFRARGGLDDGGANQGPAASVRFLVYSRRPADVPGNPAAVAQGEVDAGAEDFDRAALAAAIADPENPLTARVMVNRVWQHHFGRGLVGTSSNFGELGERPTHPELLDWLAKRFVESGWSVKSLHRDVVLSATYRLSSDADPRALEVDPENRLLWRASRRRLDVEAFRDALLFVSGRLDESLGGPTTNLADPGNVRRTVYARISRHELDGLLRLFDFPDANVTAATRTNTTVPQQQLFVLNGEFFVRQAKALAARVQKAADADDDRIRLAYRLCYGRPPTETELAVGREFLSAAATAEGNSLAPWEQYAQALLAANEFLYVD